MLAIWHSRKGCRAVLFFTKNILLLTRKKMNTVILNFMVPLIKKILIYKYIFKIYIWVLHT